MTTKLPIPTKEDVARIFDIGDMDGTAITVEPYGEGYRLEISRMYEYVPLGFAQLSALSEFSGTKNIGNPEQDQFDGCETCDYGSRYAVSLVVLPDRAMS